MEKVFHMNGGIDHVSYAKNSFLQKMAGDTMKHITLEMVRELYLSYTPNSLGIADLGCSSGHNSLSIIKEMVGTIEKVSHDISKPMSEIRVYMNDLPTNDFNQIFVNLPEFYKDLQKVKNSETTSIYIGAYPGSFYGRLFPNMSLHFIYAAFSLHWLSKVPRDLYDDQGRSINKASMYISESSPPQVSKAYHRQFQEDMTMFLKSRAEEVVGGGKMVLLLLGRIGANHIDRGNYILWELLARSFIILVSQGEIEEEKFESYNTHFYAPSKEEFQEEVRKEDSFEIERLDMFEIDRNIPDGMSYGKVVASAIRAIQETAIRHHFGDKIIDSLFDHYARLLDEETSKTKTCEIALVVVLSKKI